MEKNIDREFRARSERADFLSALASLCCFFPPLVILGAFVTDRIDILILIIVTLEVILFAAALILNSALCIVKANRNCVTVKNILCRNVISVKDYEYRDIEAAESRVVQYKSRRGAYVSYGMSVTIRLKNGKTLKYCNGLKISCNLHRDDPKRYQRLVEEDEMFKLCAFINDIKADGKAQ